MSSLLQSAKRNPFLRGAVVPFGLFESGAPWGGALPSRRRRRLASVATAVAALATLLIGCSGGYDAPGTGQQSGIGASAPTSPGAGSPTEADPLAELRNPQELERLVQEHGADSVATLVVEEMPVMKTRFLQQKIQAAAPGVGFRAKGKGALTLAYLAPIDDLEEFAANLDLGEATIDAEKRVITVKADPAKFSDEAAEAISQVARARRKRPTAPARDPLWHAQFQNEYPPNSVLVTVYGVDPKVVREVVGYVRQAHPGLTISEEELAGCPCTFVCSGAEDIEALAGSLNLGTVTGIDKQQLRLNVSFDLDQVRQSAGPAVAALLDPNSLEWALEDLNSYDPMRRSSALQRLRNFQPDEQRRPTVVKALLEALTEPDDGERLPKAFQEEVFHRFGEVNIRIGDHNKTVNLPENILQRFGQGFPRSNLLAHDGQIQERRGLPQGLVLFPAFW